SQLLSDNESNSGVKTGENFFFCTQCVCKVNTSADFLKHCFNSHNTTNNGSFNKLVISKQAEEFIIKLVDAPRSIVVVLMLGEMKSRFMNRYSNDLLVANEETALCLEELNRENNNSMIEDEEQENETIGSVNSSSSTHHEHHPHDLSLLFIDYSIIQFGRVIK